MSNPMVLVVGAGPGVSGSVARRWGSEGYDVALAGRDDEALTTLGTSLQQAGVTTGWTSVDITDEDAFREAVARFAGHSGRIDVVHFNPSAFRHKDPLSLTPTELNEDMSLGVGALLTAVQASRPHMPAGGRITATGSLAADKPWNEAASLGVQKAGLRNLIRSIDTTLAPAGIRAVTVTVQGSLAYDDPTSRFHPDQVAQALFDAAHQPEESWQTEVPYPS